MKAIVDKPDLYDLLYQDVKEDIKMYIKLLKDKRNILEFGAGTGRVTIPLSLDNHFIEAVDLSKDMLNKLKTKIETDKYLKSHIKPVLGNMCNYKTEIKFDAVIIPLTSFNYLLNEEDQQKCLNNVRDSLLEDGCAIVELLSKKTFLDTNKSDELSFIKRIKINNNSYYDYYRTTKLDLNNRKIEQRRLFKYYKNNIFIKEEELEWKNRFVTIDDFSYLASASGLEIDNIYGNCNLEEYNANSEDVFIKLRRK